MTKELKSQIEITQILKQEKKELQDSISYLIQSNEIFKLELLNSVIEKENNKDYDKRLPTYSIINKDINESIIEEKDNIEIEKKYDNE